MHSQNYCLTFKNNTYCNNILLSNHWGDIHFEILIKTQSAPYKRIIVLAIEQILLWKSSLYQYSENERTGFYRTGVSWSVCYVFALSIACSFPSLTFLFKELWSAILARADLSAAEMWAALFWTGGGEARRDRNRGRLTGREGETGGGGGKSPGEVNGWNARCGSVNEPHAGLGGTAGIVSRQQGSQWLWLTPKQHFMAGDTSYRPWLGIYAPTTPRVSTTLSLFYGESYMIGNSFISFVFYVLESMKLCQ